MRRRLDQLRRQLLADRKKLGVVIVLAVFGLLMWGRLLLKDVPRTATAQPRRAGGSSSLSDSPSQTSSKSAKVEVVRINVPDRLQRDLFSVDPSRYRQTLYSDSAENLFKSDNSDPQPADENLSVTEALSLASRLELQSILTGAQARAVISDVLVAPGERIDGFELLDVVDRSVILERNGIVIRLWM